MSDLSTRSIPSWVLRAYNEVLVTDDQVANLHDGIDLQVRANSAMAEYAVKGYDKAESDIKAMQAKGRVAQFKATECPKLTRLVTTWPAPPPPR